MFLKYTNERLRKILKAKWAVKIKTLTNWTPFKYKARYCVRGDKKIDGVNLFETYTSVVQLSIVRIVFTMIVYNGWRKKQVDYTNVLVQSLIQEDIYILNLLEVFKE